MKTIKYILALACVALFASCQEKVDKTIEWPQWASRPILENVKIAGVDGSNVVTAGDKVVFTADVHDDYNELKQYSLTISYNGDLAYEKVVELTGSKISINEEFVMPFSTNLTDNLIPEITFQAYNVENGYSVTRIANSANVTVKRPAIPDEMYVVDNAGNKFRIVKNGEYAFSMPDDVDLSSLGTSFHIAAKVSGGKPDFSGVVWGMVDGKISAVTSTSGTSIPTPDSNGYGFKKIGFNTFNFNLQKMLNYKVVVDINEMDKDDYSGVIYKIKKAAQLYRYSEVEFVGFGDIANMLQLDRFEILNSTTAIFTGHSRKWTFYYDENDNWMILNYVNNNEPDQVWFTGAAACFPQGNDNTANVFNHFEGDGKARFGTLAAVAGEDGVYRCLLYLQAGFSLEIYSWVKWSTVLTLNSLDDTYAVVTADKHYIEAGSAFAPGLYIIEITRTTLPNDVGDGCIADVKVYPYVK